MVETLNQNQEDQGGKSAGGCATDCGLKAFSPQCASEQGGCGSKPPVAAWVGLSVALFAIAVWLLGNFGKPILDSMGRGEKTIAYIDMARQSMQVRDYSTAEKLYKQSILDAEMQGGGDNLAYALATYAEFLRKRKRIAEAVPLELRAKEIQGIEKSGNPASTAAAPASVQ